MNDTPTEAKPQLLALMIHPGRLWWGRRIAIGGMLVTMLGTMVLGLNHQSSAPEMQVFEQVRGGGLVVMFFGLVLILAAYPRKLPHRFVPWFSGQKGATAQLWLNALGNAGCLYVFAIITMMVAIVWPPVLALSHLGIISFIAVGICAVKPRDRYYLVAALVPYVIVAVLGEEQFLRSLTVAYSNQRYFGWQASSNSLAISLMATLFGAPLLGFWGVLSGLWFERSSR